MIHVRHLMQHVTHREQPGSGGYRITDVSFTTEEDTAHAKERRLFATSDLKIHITDHSFQQARHQCSGDRDEHGPRALPMGPSPQELQMLRRILCSMSHEKLTASWAGADYLNMTILVSKREAWREVILLVEMLKRLFLGPHLEYFFPRNNITKI